MNLKQWGLFVACIVATASALVVGCGRERERATTTGASNTADSAASNTASNTTTLALEPNTVTIGYQPSLTAPQPLIGLQEGEFTRRIDNVAFKGKVLPSDSAVLSNLRSSNVDIAYTSAATAVKAYLETKNVVLLGACSSRVNGAMTQQSLPQQRSSLESVYVTTRKFVQANPNFVRRFVAANHAITDDLNANRTKADARIVDAWSKASGKKLVPSAAATTLKTLRFTSEADLKSLPSSASQQNSNLPGFLYNPGKL